MVGYDVRIWNGMKLDGGGVYSWYDKFVLKYCVFYCGWVVCVGVSELFCVSWWC